QAWVYGSHLCAMAGIGDKVNFVSTGDASTMLGAFRTSQVDAITAFALVYFAVQDEKLGKAVFDATDSAQWNKYFGSNFPGLCVFALEEQIKAQPQLTQSIVNATYRALLYIRKTSAEDLAKLVQTQYMQGFKREVAVREIGFLKPLFDHNGNITETEFNNGGKIWFGDLTKVHPQTFNAIVDLSFLKNAQKKFT